jgi:hypothetical protein
MLLVSLILAGAVPAQEYGKPITYQYIEVEETDERVVSVTAVPILGLRSLPCQL